MQTQHSIEQRIRNLKQARTASFVVCLSLVTLGMFEVGYVGRFIIVQAMYNGFVMIAASTIFMALAGISAKKLKEIEGV